MLDLYLDVLQSEQIWAFEICALKLKNKYTWMLEAKEWRRKKKKTLENDLEKYNMICISVSATAYLSIC